MEIVVTNSDQFSCPTCGGEFDFLIDSQEADGCVRLSCSCRSRCAEEGAETHFRLVLVPEMVAIWLSPEEVAAETAFTDRAQELP